MGNMLFGVAPADPIALTATALVISAVGLAACLLPSSRAARVHPMEALRSD
jgi:ABC-type antimicrobial peptide transport system permease subunit